jgi:hypothetical protein
MKQASTRFNPQPDLLPVACNAEAERLTLYSSGVGIVARLDDKQFNGYRLRRIPHPIGDVVAGVVGAYRDGSPAERQAILSEMTAKPAAVLCAAAERLAGTAVRTGSVDPLRQALVAVGMAIEALDDDRDHLYPCAATDHSAALLGTSLAPLVNSVADVLPPGALAKLRAFDECDLRDRSLQAFGLRTDGDGDNFRYC